MEDYKTIQKEARAELVEKRSRFIGTACPVSTLEEASAFFQRIKSEFWDATHNVTAYFLRQGQLQRYSDDGEPQGTAGIPTLEVLKKADLVDCAIVVTRYFGGTLLGTGGLVRAYSHTARQAVEAAGVVVMCLCSRMEVACDYSFYGKLLPFLAGEGLEPEYTDFGTGVTVRFLLPSHRMEPVSEALFDASAGRFQAKEIERIFSAVKP